MSKNPTPRIDQLRAMREAQFARNEERQKEEAVVEGPPAKSAKKKKVKKKTGPETLKRD